MNQSYVELGFPNFLFMFCSCCKEQGTSADNDILTMCIKIAPALKGLGFTRWFTRLSSFPWKCCTNNLGMLCFFFYP